ncbi:MAG: hypothetical protein OEW24_04050 [Chloroflexota bacterium]|nr:hypothetical protein [Chloroflexota bacterium]
MSGRFAIRAGDSLLRVLLACGLLWVAAVAVAPRFSPLDAATGYTMETHVRYAVNADARQIAVSVEVIFTNTTPDSGRASSGFDQVELAVHQGASQLEAEDASGPLTASLVTDGVEHASVSMRSRVRADATATFVVRYVLDDGSPDVHVRPQVVQFAAWAIGTAGDVSVEVPADYEVRSAGQEMTVRDEGGTTVLESGPIVDPAGWAVRISGVRESSYVTESASVALASGTVDLRVSAWPDDPGWGRRTLALLVAALPILEEAVGLPYPRVGPLVVRESVADPSSIGEPLTSGAEILAAFDEPEFTVLHQAAHLWIDERLAADVWIREGLASHIAASAARVLGVDLPYDPARRSSDLQGAAFPLNAWTADTDAYGHAAAWALIDRIGATIGEGRLRLALARIAAGITGYSPADPEPVAVDGRPFAPTDSRRFLDQLSAVSGSDLSDAFAATVFGLDARDELASRAVARFALADLLSVAGDWGAPESLLGAMAEWRFEEARREISDARAWLTDRDALVIQVAAMGLSTPTRLRDAYRADGGGPDARAELDAAQAVVQAYATVRQRAATEQGPLETIGLLGGADPDALLAAAAAAFGQGDLRGAAEDIDLASAQLDRSSSDALVRISVVMVLIGLVGYGALRVAQRSRDDGYTAGS